MAHTKIFKGRRFAKESPKITCPHCGGELPSKIAIIKRPPINLKLTLGRKLVSLGRKLEGGK